MTVEVLDSLEHHATVLQVQKWTLLDTDFTIAGEELGMVCYRDHMSSCDCMIHIRSYVEA